MAVAFSSAAAKAVAEARSHLGYREGPKNNENKFGKRYGWNYVAWCVQFAWYVGDVTGSGGGIPKTASTGAAMRWAKSVGRWRSTPQAGDWSIMVNSRGATIHTDVVESYRNGRLICIGGNTSGTYNGSVNEGNGVYRNDRTARWKQGRILGFVRPFYGLSESDVKTVQKAVGAPADGKMGPKTVAAVKAAQSKLGLSVDGFPGPKTISALTGSNVADKVEDIPVPPAASSDVEVDGRLGKETATELQTRLKTFSPGLVVDGVVGENTIKVMQAYLESPYVDGEISRQPQKAKDLGNGYNKNIIHVGDGNSPFIKRWQAYVGATIDGRLGEETIKRTQIMMNQYDAVFTKADQGVAIDRAKKAKV